MQVTILHRGTCPVCGYRNEGLRVGTARPGMRQLRLEARSFGYVPPACRECGHPMALDLYDRWCLDVASTGKLKAWQERQRAKRKARTA